MDAIASVEPASGRTIQRGWSRHLRHGDWAKARPCSCCTAEGPARSGLSNFSRNIPALAERFRLIVPDMPGYGRSIQGPRPQGPVRRSRPGDARPSRRARRREGPCPRQLARRRLRAAAWRSRRPSASIASCCSGPAGSTRAAGRRPRAFSTCSTTIPAKARPARNSRQFLRKDLVFDGAALPDALIDGALRGEPRSGGRRQPAARAPEGPVERARSGPHARSAAWARWKRRRWSSGASRIGSIRRAAAARCRSGCRTATSICSAAPATGCSGSAPPSSTRRRSPFSRSRQSAAPPAAKLNGAFMNAIDSQTADAVRLRRGSARIRPRRIRLGSPNGSGSPPRGSAWRIGEATPTTLALRTDAHARRLIVRKSAKEDIALGWQVDGDAALKTILGAARRAQDRGRGGRGRGGGAARRREVLALSRARSVRRSNCSSSPRSRRPRKRSVSAFVTGERGLGHVAITTRKPEAMIAFWREIFDAKISDFIEDRICGVDLQFHLSARQSAPSLDRRRRDARDSRWTRSRRKSSISKCRRRRLTTSAQPTAAVARLGFKIAMAVGQHPNDRDVSFYAVTPSGFYFELGWSSEGDEDSRGLAAGDPPGHQPLGPQAAGPDARRQARADAQRRDLAVAHRILAFLNKNSLSEGNALWTRLRTSMTSQSSGSARPG